MKKPIKQVYLANKPQTFYVVTNGQVVNTILGDVNFSAPNCFPVPAGHTGPLLYCSADPVTGALGPLITTPVPVPDGSGAMMDLGALSKANKQALQRGDNIMSPQYAVPTKPAPKV